MINPDMDKIGLSKQRMRRKLAQLPIADKLRILEELREEKLPRHGKRNFQTDGNSGRPITSPAVPAAPPSTPPPAGSSSR
jgi:hypothetical protein